MEIEKNFKILLKEKVITKDIPRLSKSNKEKISKIINEKLAVSPELFSKPLRYSFKGHRSIRIGDYRIVFKIKDNECHILKIGHRRDIYKNLFNRLD